MFFNISQVLLDAKHLINRLSREPSEKKKEKPFFKILL